MEPTAVHLFASHKIQRLLAAAALMLSAALEASWDAEYESVVQAGIDSNVYGERSGEVEDEFAGATQSFLFSRKGSVTKLDIAGNISKNYYFSERDADYLIGGLNVDFAYPDGVEAKTYWRGGLFWRRDSQVSLEAGRRLVPDLYGFNLAGEWLFQSKTGLVAWLRSNTSDRSRDGYNTTRSWRFLTGVSTELRAEQRWSVEYGINFSETDAAASTDAEHHMLGVRGRGKLTSKVTGELFGGIRSSDFTGVYDFSDSGPFLSMDLVWAYSPQFTAFLQFDSEYNFTANGTVALEHVLNLRVKRELGKGYRVALGVARGLSDYENSALDIGRDDRFWRVRAELEYAFTEQFFARASYELVDNASSLVGRDVNRTLISVSSGLRY